MFCSQCGKENPDSSLFCMKCGHSLPGIQAVTSPIPQKKSHAGLIIGLTASGLVLITVLLVLFLGVIPMLNKQSGDRGIETTETVAESAIVGLWSNEDTATVLKFKTNGDVTIYTNQDNIKGTFEYDETGKKGVIAVETGDYNFSVSQDELVIDEAGSGNTGIFTKVDDKNFDIQEFIVNNIHTTPTTTAQETTKSFSTTTAATTAAAGTFELALITDVGNIDDKSFNEGAWNGVKNYAEKNNISYAYYRPSEDSTAAREETIGTAIEKGAKIVVCPGYLFEEAIYNVQDKYSDVQFLLLDGQPHTADYATFKTAANVHCILYQEEQAGYLAGYAAVMDGYTKLGFLGGMAVPAVVRYGYGYIQGAETAATELKLAAGSVEIKYWYCGGFASTDDIKTKMSGWYTDGTQVVFSCGGGIYLSATAAAEAAKGKVIGVDVDQASQSPTIITSAMKDLSNSVVLALTSIYENGGKWTTAYAGTTATLGAKDNCVGLPTAKDSWRLTKFTVDQYKAVFAKLVDGSVVVSNDTENVPKTIIVKVDVQS